MEKRLLSILCCPVTHKQLSVASRELLAKVNGAVGDGQLRNRGGAPLSEQLSEALVTEDGKILYPVDDGIPVLLEGESIMLEQLESAAGHG